MMKKFFFTSIEVIKRAYKKKLLRGSGNKKGNHRFCVERVYKIVQKKKNVGMGRKNRMGRKP